MEYLYADFSASKSYTHSKTQTRQSLPFGPLIVLGQTALHGTLIGFLAIELVRSDDQPVKSKLWTLIENEHGTSCGDARAVAEQVPYARLCVDTFTDTEDGILSFWIDPNDPLTNTAGLGSQWLLTEDRAPAGRFVLAKLNTLMLCSEALLALAPLRH